MMTPLEVNEGFTLSFYRFNGLVSFEKVIYIDKF